MVISFISLLAGRPVRRINSLARLFVSSPQKICVGFHFLKHTRLITSVSFGVNEVKLWKYRVLSETTSSRIEAMAGFFLHLSAATGSHVGLTAQQPKMLPKIEEIFAAYRGWIRGKNLGTNGDDMRDFFSEALRIRVIFCLL